MTALETFKHQVNELARYSGWAFIKSKFRVQPADAPREPVGVLWLVAIYVTFFGLATQNYAASLYRAESLSFARTPFKLLENLDDPTKSREYMQSAVVLVPVEPELLDPLATVLGFFGTPSFALRSGDPTALKLFIEQLKAINNKVEGAQLTFHKYSACNDVRWDDSDSFDYDIGKLERWTYSTTLDSESVGCVLTLLSAHSGQESFVFPKKYFGKSL